MDWPIEYNRGAQTFRTVAYDGRGKPRIPSSASYAIVNLSLHEDDTDRVVQASGSATIDPAATVTTASAGGGTADPKRIQCADGDDFEAGRRYLIRGDDGQEEMFLIDHKSGDDLYADAELKFRYASMASVLGIEIPWTFPAATANDEAEITRHTPFGVDWAFEGLTPAYRRDLARIVRMDLQILATLEDIEEIDQVVIVSARGRVRWDACLRRANREISTEMRIRRIDPHDQHLGQVGRDLAAWYAYWLGLRLMGSGVEQKVIDARSRYRYLETVLFEGKAVLGSATHDRVSDATSDSPNVYRSPFAES